MGRDNRGNYGGSQGNRPEQDHAVQQISGQIRTLAGFDQFAAKDMVLAARQIANAISDDLKNSQLRRLYGMVKKIESQRRTQDRRGNEQERDHYTAEQLELLRPRLFYAAGRQAGVRPLRDIMDEAITAVNKRAYDSLPPIPEDEPVPGEDKAMKGAKSKARKDAVAAAKKTVDDYEAAFKRFIEFFEAIVAYNTKR